MSYGRKPSINNNHYLHITLLFASSDFFGVSWYIAPVLFKLLLYQYLWLRENDEAKQTEHLKYVANNYVESY